MTQIIKMEINEIEIPKDMLPHAPKVASLRGYALSRHTIGISFHPVEKWAKRALWEGEVRVEETADSIILLLPQVLSSFYNITQDNITVSTSPKTNTIQIDIE
jgi:hypothetical protein